jgi:hypothetical protein
MIMEFHFDDVPADLKNDPDFVYFGCDLFDQIENEVLTNTRKALQANAILLGYTYAQVKQASDERLRVMNDPNTRRNRVAKV